MAHKQKTEDLLSEGYYPSQIAGQMTISVTSVIQYLCLRVGEG